MPIRSTPLVTNEVYHVYLRSVEKIPIFFYKEERVRFLLYILFLQSDKHIDDPATLTRRFLKYGTFVSHRTPVQSIVDRRMVELMAFCVMTNHFHLIVRQKSDRGISDYMMRALASYAKYYNAKHDRVGRVFASEFKSKHISDNRQLLHTSAYVHRNPRELKGWVGKESVYPWSSFYDYTHSNRWNDLLVTSLILEQFKNSTEYKGFVDSSPAKLE